MNNFNYSTEILQFLFLSQADEYFHSTTIQCKEELVDKITETSTVNQCQLWMSRNRFGNLCNIFANFNG